MATIQFKKGDEYLAKIAKLYAASRDKICGRATYGAAEIVADEIRSQLRQVPTDDSSDSFFGEVDGPKKVQKKGLYDSLGIASMQDDGTGFLNVKIGFDGYNDVKTKRWPQGQPNQMIARSVERGTSFMKANPFVKPAMQKTTKKAIKHMKESVDESIEEIMKKG